MVQYCELSLLPPASQYHTVLALCCMFMLQVQPTTVSWKVFQLTFIVLCFNSDQFAILNDVVLAASHDHVRDQKYSTQLSDLKEQKQ